uniref:RanBD1 domain-containing protein n=1 Tax=Rhabditophanes sp. KR3021 TaxID=114890 RepID=A0AC35TWC2_9BILA
MSQSNSLYNPISVNDDKESSNIVEQISAYIKANTTAMNNILLFIQKESADNRRFFTQVKGSLEAVHDGLDILANRVASINKMNNADVSASQTQNLEMDRLIKLVETLSVKQDSFSAAQQHLKQQYDLQHLQQQQAGMGQLMGMRPELQQQQQVAMMQAAQIFAQQQNAFLRQQQPNSIAMMQAMTNAQRPMVPNQMFQGANTTHVAQGSNLLPIDVKPPAQLTPSVAPVQPTPSVVPVQPTPFVVPVQPTPSVIPAQPTPSIVTAAPISGDSKSVAQTSTPLKLCDDGRKKSELTELKATETKPSIFGNVSAPSNPPSIFGNVSIKPANSFSFTPIVPTTPVAPIEEKEECPEDYECNANFEPVIPLPDLVKVSTGEEDEAVLFTSRAKLFKFTDGKEFKERGVGDLKILKHNATGKTRVVMRRDQTFKVCANFAISNGMTVSLKANTTKVVIFSCYDTSDETPGHATFCLKFGEETSTTRFMEEFNNAGKEPESSSLVNEVALKKVAAGVVPEVKHIEEIKKTSVVTPASPAQQEKGDNESDFSDDEDEQEDEEDYEEDYDEEENERVQDPNYYKVKESLPGSWNCKECYITNDPDVIECVACLTPKDGSAAKPIAKSLFAPTTFPSTTSSPFSFGFNAKTETKSETPPAALKLFPNLGKDAEEKVIPAPFNMDALSESLAAKSTPTTANLFDKPNAMSSFSFAAKADNSPATGNIFGTKPLSFETKSTGTSIFDTNESKSSFFGGSNDTPKPSLFGGSKDTSKPSLFGGSTNVPSNAPISIFGSNSFGASTKPKDDTKPFELSVKPNEQDKPKEGVKTFGASTFQGIKVDLNQKQPAVPTTEAVTQKPTNIFGSGLAQTATSFSDVIPANGGFLNNSGTHSNLFNIKASDHKLFASPKPATEEGDDRVEDYESDAHFEPVIPLPDKIEIITGEEDEIELLRIHTKLFIMNTAEKAWKERGTGTLKVLKDKTSEKYRILMRRDQVHNLCANMPLASCMIFNSTESRPKIIVFKAFDFSDDIDNGINGTYAIRFNNVEDAEQFSKVANDCVAKLS